jgi:hypothetical protein
MKKILKEVRKVVIKNHEEQKIKRKIKNSNNQDSNIKKKPKPKLSIKEILEGQKENSKEEIKEIKEISKEQIETLKENKENIEEISKIGKERNLEDLTIEESKEEEVIKLKKKMLKNSFYFQCRLNSLTDKELKIFFNSKLIPKTKPRSILRMIEIYYNSGININLTDQNKKLIYELFGMNYDHTIKFLKILKMGKYIII